MTKKIIWILGFLDFLLIFYVLLHVNSFKVLFTLILMEFILSICIHEIGHLIVGSILGLKLIYIKLPFLKIELVKNKYDIFLSRNIWDWFGSIMMVNKENHCNRKLGLYFLGGPLLSILVSLVAFFLENNIFGLINIAIGLATLIPLNVKDISTDGYKAAKFFLHDDSFWLVFKISNILIQEFNNTSFVHSSEVIEYLKTNFNKDDWSNKTVLLLYLNYYIVLKKAEISSSEFTSISSLLNSLYILQDKSNPYILSELMTFNFIIGKNFTVKADDKIINKLDILTRRRLNAITSKSQVSKVNYENSIKTEKRLLSNSVIMTGEKKYLSIIEKSI